MTEAEVGGNVQYGGFWRRFVAFWIDVVLATLLLFPILGMLGVSDGLLRVGHMGVKEQVIWNLPFMLAATLFIYYRQATPGKMLLGLRVVDAKTLGNPTFAQALGRQVAYLLSSLVLFLGFIWIAFSERKRGWHDLLAGTVVIRK
jgi:uncharacterized RDD family membrane protein YckC